MLKYLTAVSAIALAIGLQGCATTPFSDGSSASASDVQDSQNLPKVKEQEAIAEASMAAGDPATAVRIYRRLTREYPLSIQPRIKLGEALLASNAPQEAARAFKGANGIRDTFEGLIGLGRVELALRDPGEALKQFDKAAKIKPDDPLVMNGRAVALDQLGHHDDAQKIYLSLLQQDPSNIKVRNNYALSLALAGKYDDATDILQSLVQVPDAEERMRQNLALVYGLEGNDGQAAHFGRMDLDEDAVNNNLKYYQAMRNLDSPTARAADLTKPPADDLAATPAQPGKTALNGSSQAEPADSANAAPMGWQSAQAKTVRAGTRQPKIVANLRELPMTRAQAAAQASDQSDVVARNEPAQNHDAQIFDEAPSGLTGSIGPTTDASPTDAPASTHASERKAAEQKQIALASPAPQAVAKPAKRSAHQAANGSTAKEPAAQQSAHRRLPAVPPVGPLASRALDAPAPATHHMTDRDAKQPAGKTGSISGAIESNPVDTGARAPAVPALL